MKAGGWRFVRLIEVGVLVGVLALPCLSQADAAEQVALEDLRWLTGHWTGSLDDVEMEEFWTEARGGLMLGLHRDVFAARPTFFEYLRIEERESAIVYIASPRGGDATEFVLVSFAADEVQFENLEHDFPQRIMYRRQGDLLVVQIEGEVSGETRSIRWQWKRSD